MSRMMFLGFLGSFTWLETVLSLTWTETQEFKNSVKNKEIIKRREFLEFIVYGFNTKIDIKKNYGIKDLKFIVRKQKSKGYY
jgi:hypothetical protein